MLFDDRAWGAKVAAALALIAALGLAAYYRGRDLQPSPTRLLTTPARWDGATIWLPAARVVAVHPGGCRVEADGVLLDVAGEAEMGALLGIRGVFRADGPFLEPIRMRPLPEEGWNRRLIEGVSLAVLALVLWNLRRHFRVHPPAARVEGGD